MEIYEHISVSSNLQRKKLCEAVGNIRLLLNKVNLEFYKVVKSCTRLICQEVPNVHRIKILETKNRYQIWRP